MSILVLGGRGKTSSRLARLLAQANIPFILASRTVSDTVPYPQTQFDWDDKTTYPKLFADARAKTGKPVSAVYIVASASADVGQQLKDFIDVAVKENNVSRIVLLTASTMEKGGPGMGQGHEYLVKLHEEIGLEYTVLRPTWFQENFSEAIHLPTIKAEGKIYSAMQDGTVPLVSVEDIAAVAFRTLTDPRPHNTDYLILGPTQLSYDEVAKILSDVSGRPITHVKLSTDEEARRFASFGLPGDFARALAEMEEAAVASGVEGKKSSDAVLRVTGRPPRGFCEYAVRNKHVWV
ncbi:hypothetical protein VTN31DRAFT_4879 [Thermomyces dupontii]|uniref:uncharacterized protein n=1 Tax=Talaromyces thermophilus TaxID=28565 RepID=UPI003742FE84